MTDILEDLDRWLYGAHGMPDYCRSELIQRARDEIAVLRETYFHDILKIQQVYAEENFPGVRNEALEEAAQAASAAIRGLKNKP